jgi:predicted ABC-type ATPase
MASLLVVTGPPGAGKSTVAGILASRAEPSVLVAGDDFFGFLARGAVPPWRPESARQNEVVIQAAAAAAGRFVQGGFETVYDGVVGPWFLPTFATATGCDQLDYVVILPPVERCLARVASRVGHGFTDKAATRKMHGEFAGADIDARHVLVERPGSAGAADTAESVADRIEAARARGTLTFDVAGQRTSMP